MRKPIRHRLLSTAATLVLLVSDLSGQIRQLAALSDVRGSNAGNTGLLFLTLPADAVGLARGTTSLPPPDNATALHSAIASSAFLDCNAFAINHTQWLLDLRKESVAGCFPVLDLGTVGVAARVFTLGSSSYSRDIDERPSRTAYTEFSAGGTISRVLVPELLAAGLGVGYVESRLDGTAARTVSACADMALTSRWINARMGIAHAGPPLTYIADPVYLPLQVTAGIRIKPLANKLLLREYVDFDCALGAEKIADEPLIAGLSTEITLLRHGKIRAGYEYAPGATPGLEGVGLGAGVSVGRYGADFGWKYHSEALGSVWAITATARGKPVLPTTAEEFYAIAERHWTRGRSRRTLDYARRALKLNPNMWKAHALSAKAAADIRRNQGTEIGIVYAGNLQGQFVPFDHRNATVGGLARQAAVIRNLRAQYPRSFIISTGNFLSRNSHPLRTNLASWYFGHVGFDAGAAGGNEVHLLLDSTATGLWDKHICTNLRNGKTPFRVISAGHHAIFIASVIFAEKNLSDSGPFDDEIESARRVLSSSDATAASVRILIVHGNWDAVNRCAQSLPQADVIICGSLNQAFEAPMRAGSSLVLSPGDSGRYVGELTLRLNRERSIISHTHRLIPLIDTITPVAQVQREVDKVAAQLESHPPERSAEMIAHRSAGLFPFVSNRRGAGHIYLKAPEHHAEHPVTSGAASHARPRMSPDAAAVAVLIYDEETAITGLEVVAVGTGRRRPLITGRNVVEAEFSPNGKWIYAAVCPSGSSRSTDIIRLTPDGSATLPVISWEGSSERDICFAEHGRLMAFCSDRDRRWHVYLSAPDGTNPVRITDAVANHRRPRFGPDSLSLAYLSDRTSARNRMDVWIHDLPTGKARQITRLARVDRYVWLDRDNIAYSSFADSTGIHIVNIRTAREPRRLPTATPPGWRVSALRIITVQGQDLIIYSREARDGRRQIHAILPDGTGDIRFVKSAGSDWIE